MAVKAVEQSVEDTKGFYDYNEDELVTTIATERYHLLRVTETTNSFWSDGRDRGQAITEVAEGLDQGRRGPRLTFSHQGSSGTSRAGKSFHIPDEDAQKRFIRDIRAIHDIYSDDDTNIVTNEIPFSNPTAFDTMMMAEAMEAIEGDLFIAWVAKDGQYTRATQLFRLSNPPDDYQTDEEAAGFDA